MPIVNSLHKQIVAKVVYVGPGLSGKTTNIEHLHKSFDPKERGRLIQTETDGDRTLFFDALPVNAGKIHGMNLRFQLYTAPGQVYYNTSRRMVLRNADGIVFVADSSPDRLEANQEALENLYDNAAALGIDVATMPLVVQFNKRDYAMATDLMILQQQLNFENAPAFEAIAIHGVGVVETLEEILKLTARKLETSGGQRRGLV